MASRRDQLHSYQFMIQRVVAALVMRETDPAQSPFRRAAGAIFAGVMVAAILVAGFAVYGLWKPGGNVQWKNEADRDGRPVALVEKETGAAYVYFNKVLYPAENYTSALLAAAGKGGSAEPVHVSRDSLAETEGVRISYRIGIVDAPDSLPSPENLIKGDWTVCSQPSAGPSKLETLMVIGERPRQHRRFGAQGAMLVQDADTNAGKFLIYSGHRFPIPERFERYVLQAMSVGDGDAVKVSGAWLNVLPLGQEIAPLDISGKGTLSNLGGGIKVGELFKVTNAGTVTWYVALRDSLAEITELQAEILETFDGVEARLISTADAVRLNPSDSLLPSEQKSAAPPESATALTNHWVKAQPDSATCAIFTAKGTGVPDLVHSASMRGFDNAGVFTETQDPYGNKLVTRVVLPPGKGAVVWASQNPESQVGGSLCLITDTGSAHTLASQDVLKYLGYQDAVVAGWMPSYLVARLPAGPSLDPVSAWQQVADS